MYYRMTVAGLERDVRADDAQRRHGPQPLECGQEPRLERGPELGDGLPRRLDFPYADGFFAEEPGIPQVGRVRKALIGGHARIIFDSRYSHLQTC